MLSVKRRAISIFVGGLVSFSFLSYLPAAENLTITSSKNEQTSLAQMKEILEKLKAKFKELRHIQDKLRQEIKDKDAQIEELRARLSYRQDNSSEGNYTYYKKINELVAELNEKDKKISQLNDLVDEVLRQIEELNKLE